MLEYLFIIKLCHYILVVDVGFVTKINWGEPHISHVEAAFSLLTQSPFLAGSFIGSSSDLLSLNLNRRLRHAAYMYIICAYHRRLREDCLSRSLRLSKCILKAH